MPPTIDTSRMSVEQMRALSAEKQHERQGKKEKEAREWARCADQLEAALLHRSRCLPLPCKLRCHPCFSRLSIPARSHGAAAAAPGALP